MRLLTPYVANLSLFAAAAAAAAQHSAAAKSDDDGDGYNDDYKMTMISIIPRNISPTVSSDYAAVLLPEHSNSSVSCWICSGTVVPSSTTIIANLSFAGLRGTSFNSSLIALGSLVYATSFITLSLNFGVFCLMIFYSTPSPTSSSRAHQLSFSSGAFLE
jgi:hypothetical protein